MNRSIAILSLVVLAACAGCDYQPAPITSADVDKALTVPQASVLRVQAGAMVHPLLKPVVFRTPMNLDSGAGGPGDGIGPDEAAVLAVLINPSLRAVRDQRGLQQAQVLEAGLLPNPTLEWTNDFPFRGPAAMIAWGLTMRWDLSALISRGARVDAAKGKAASVDLDIAWQEWQVAQAARQAVYHVVALEAQLGQARQWDQRLKENLATIQKAVDQQQKTEVDLAAAQTASQDAHAAVLGLERELGRQRQALKRAIGLPAGGEVAIRAGVELPSYVAVPDAAGLAKGLEDRRLDLVALHRGYDSQEATVRAAVLSRFPKIAVGPEISRDNTETYMAGYGISAELPIFNQSQGTIAIEHATSRKLRDEFINRIFEARSDIATAAGEIKSLNAQIAYAQAALPANETLVSAYAKALAAGNADVLTYYAARNDLARKKIDITKLKGELVDAWIGLENASGQYLQQP
jgi:outer membrane protein TolC